MHKITFEHLNTARIRRVASWHRWFGGMDFGVACWNSYQVQFLVDLFYTFCSTFCLKKLIFNDRLNINVLQ